MKNYLIVFYCACRLTVEEHMWIYARLKGMQAAEISAEMDKFVDIL